MTFVRIGIVRVLSDSCMWQAAAIIQIRIGAVRSFVRQLHFQVPGLVPALGNGFVRIDEAVRNFVDSCMYRQTEQLRSGWWL